MKTKAERHLEGTGRLLRVVRGSVIATLLIACGGALGEVQTSGESHFLRRCDDSCAAGLTCISNVCTRSCLVGKSSCRDLAGSAVCTDQSIEPGMVAVCDQACVQDSDCAALGSRFSCDAGFCRGDKLTGAGGSGGSGSGGASGGPSGGANSGGVSGGPLGGASSGGTSGAAFGGATAGGAGGTTAGGAGGSSGGPGMPAVVECPDNVVSDPITIVRKRFRGDVFDVDVMHGGGCQPHDYTLCWGPAFLESYPVQTALRLIHNAHSDPCDALLSASLHFDLKPLADAYSRAYQAPGGIISTSFGMYAFGDLKCEERTQAASSQVGLAVEWAQASLPTQPEPICKADTECNWVATNTSCSYACGAGISNSRAADLAEGLTAIDNAVCANFRDQCPAPPLPPCAAPRPLMCSAGACVDAM